VYKLIKVILDEDDLELYRNNNANKIQCVEQHYGLFSSRLDAQNFITKNNIDKNCFFILYSWILNPTGENQINSWVTVYTYDYSGMLICGNITHRFVVNEHDFNKENKIRFNGRSDDTIIAHKNDKVLCYDEYSQQLFVAKVINIPIKNEQCDMEWYDDSYIVKPLYSRTNHIHILSCFTFKIDKFS